MLQRRRKAPQRVHGRRTAVVARTATQTSTAPTSNRILAEICLSVTTATSGEEIPTSTKRQSDDRSLVSRPTCHQILEEPVEDCRFRSTMATDLTHRPRATECKPSCPAVWTVSHTTSLVAALASSRCRSTLAVLVVSTGRLAFGWLGRSLVIGVLAIEIPRKK